MSPLAPVSESSVRTIPSDAEFLKPDGGHRPCVFSKVKTWSNVPADNLFRLMARNNGRPRLHFGLSPALRQFSLGLSLVNRPTAKIPREILGLEKVQENSTVFHASHSPGQSRCSIETLFWMASTALHSDRSDI